MENVKNEAIVKRMAQVLIIFLIEMALLLISAGTLQWLWPWVFFGVGILVITANSQLLPRELIAERGDCKHNVKKWDRVISLITTVPMLAVFIIGGLDHRFEWTGIVSPGIHILGTLLLITGHAVFTWGMISNRFFSTMVRIQDDRDHMVATAGPYRIIRHPGYVGFILQTVAVPFILGSNWGLIPAGMVCILFIIRTAYEDATLQKELNGYREYADKVRYRLIPGIW